MRSYGLSCKKVRNDIKYVYEGHVFLPQKSCSSPEIEFFLFISEKEMSLCGLHNTNNMFFFPQGNHTFNNVHKFYATITHLFLKIYKHI